VADLLAGASPSDNKKIAVTKKSLKNTTKEEEAGVGEEDEGKG
jgi:hypothetical protein